MRVTPLCGVAGSPAAVSGSQLHAFQGRVPVWMPSSIEVPSASSAAVAHPVSPSVDLLRQVAVLGANDVARRFAAGFSPYQGHRRAPSMMSAAR